MRGALSTMNDEETGTDDESALHDKEEEGREEKTKKNAAVLVAKTKSPQKMRKMPVNEIDTDEDDDEGAAYQKERARQAKQGAISKRLSAPKAKKRKETGSKNHLRARSSSQPAAAAATKTILSTKQFRPLTP